MPPLSANHQAFTQQSRIKVMLAAGLYISTLMTAMTWRTSLRLQQPTMYLLGC